MANQARLHECLARVEAGMQSPQEAIRTLMGNDHLWWRCCQEAVRENPDWLIGMQASGFLALIRAHAPGTGDERRATADSATAISRVAQALAGQPNCVSPDVLAGQASLDGMLGRASGGESESSLRDVVDLWDSAGALTPIPVGAGLLSDASLPAVPDELKSQVEAIVQAVSSTNTGPAGAMVALTALLLAGVKRHPRRVIRVSVLLGRPDAGSAAPGATGVLELREVAAGPPGLLPDPEAMGVVRADRFFRQALTLAWNASAGRSGRRCVLWRILVDGAPVSSIEGASIGAPFAIGLRELLRYPTSRRPSVAWLRGIFHGLRSRTAITGAITDTGDLAGIGDIGQKLLAAHQRGWRVIAPEENRGDIGDAPNPDAVNFAANLKEADRYARRWRPVRLSLVVAAAMALVGAGIAIKIDHAARQQASKLSAITASRQLALESEGLVASAPAAASLLAAAAWHIAPTSQAQESMLDVLAQPERAILTAGRPITGLAFSPDGKVVATAGADGMARLWDVATHQQIGPPITTGDGDLNAVAFSPDGRVLATAGADGMARLWDVTTRRQVGTPITVTHRQYGALAAVFSPDGKVLATAGADGMARLWDVATHQQIGAPLTAGGEHADAVAFSADGTMLATGDDAGQARIWDVATRRQIGAPMAASRGLGGVTGVAFNPDATILATADGDDTARLWNVSTHRQIGAAMTASRDGGTWGIAFNPSGTILATAGADGIARLWNVVTHRQVGASMTASGGGGVTALAFGRDGSTLATAGDDGTTRLWDVRIYRPIGVPITVAGGGAEVLRVVFSPDGAVMAAAYADGTARLWDVASHQQIGSPMVAVHEGAVEAVTFGQDGRVLATADTDGKARIWDVATRQQIGSPITPARGHYLLEAVAFSPDGQILATGGGDGTARLWDVATRQQIGSPINAGGGDLRALAFSPSGRLLATANDDGAARLWDLATHRQIGSSMHAGGGGLNALAFSSRGNVLATAGADGAARLWDVATGQQIGAPMTASNTQGVTGVAFRPDGKLLATTGGDNTARLWDVATGQQIGAPMTASSIEGATGVAFRPDGKLLATTGGDGTLQVWNVAFPRDQLHAVCSIAGPHPTYREWNTYIHSVPYQQVCP